tara:strand:+ start:1886 stop:2350 length:465 start_codon:yes stop_codon:yes gene_type:complete
MIKKKIFKLFLIFFVTSCSYQPIYSNKNILNYEIKEISLLGDKRISKQIITLLNIKKNTNEESGKTFSIESRVNKKVTSKDSSGNTLMYEKFVELRLAIMDGNGNSEKNKIFYANFTYPNKDNKFDLSEYEKIVEINLIQSITEQMRVFLSIQK